MRPTRFWSVALTASMLAAPGSAASQLRSSLDAATQVHSGAGTSGWSSWTAIGGLLALEHPRLSVGARAAGLTDGTRWTSRGALDAHLFAPPLGPVQLSASGTAGRGGPANLTSAWTAGVGARASLRAGGWGVWAGLDARRADADTVHERATPTLGGWRQVGRAIVSLSLAPRRFRVDGTAATLREELRTDSVFNDTLGRWDVFQHAVTVGDSGRAARQLRWDQAEARLFWSAGRLAADATLGARLGDGFGRELWADVTALYAVTSRLVIVAGAASRPGHPSSGWQRRSVATFGVRLLGASQPSVRTPPEIRPAADGFQLVPVSPGLYSLSLLVPHARTVEISGDFADWRPVAMTPAGNDRWMVTIPLAPGTHHVNVRVNGERWTAPPGLPEIEDEFNGTVGLLVVP